MSRYLICFFGVFFLLSCLSCKRKNFRAIADPEEAGIVDSNVLLSYAHYWNDLAPPPPNWPDTSGRTDFNECEQFVWSALTTLYPESSDNYWDYQIYSTFERHEDYFDTWEQRIGMYRFWMDTMPRTLSGFIQRGVPCDNARDTSFFHKYLGRPTCKTVGSAAIKYLYYVRSAHRIGPCPWIFNEGSPYESPCHNEHFTPCGVLVVNFSVDGGKFGGAAWFGL